MDGFDQAEDAIEALADQIAVRVALRLVPQLTRLAGSTEPLPNQRCGPPDGLRRTTASVSASCINTPTSSAASASAAAAARVCASTRSPCKPAGPRSAARCLPNSPSGADHDLVDGAPRTSTTTISSWSSSVSHEPRRT